MHSRVVANEPLFPGSRLSPLPSLSLPSLAGAASAVSSSSRNTSGSNVSISSKLVVVVAAAAAAAATATATAVAAATTGSSSGATTADESALSSSAAYLNSSALVERAQPRPKQRHQLTCLPPIATKRSYQEVSPKRQTALRAKKLPEKFTF